MQRGGEREMGDFARLVVKERFDVGIEKSLCCKPEGGRKVAQAMRRDTGGILKW